MYTVRGYVSCMTATTVPVEAVPTLVADHAALSACVTATQRLAARRRATIKRLHSEGVTNAAIARTLGVTEGAVRHIVNKGGDR